MAKVGKERYHLTSTADGWAASDTGGRTAGKSAKQRELERVSRPTPSPGPKRRP